MHRWNGSDLDHNQDPARQALCDYLDGVGGAAGLFDFPMKGILQARPRPAVASAPCRTEASIEHPAGSASWAGSAPLFQPSALHNSSRSHQLRSFPLSACCKAALPGRWEACVQICSCRWRQAFATFYGRRQCGRYRYVFLKALKAHLCLCAAGGCEAHAILAPARRRRQAARAAGLVADARDRVHQEP